MDDEFGSVAMLALAVPDPDRPVPVGAPVAGLCLDPHQTHVPASWGDETWLASFDDDAVEFTPLEIESPW